MKPGPNGAAPQLGMDHRAIVWCNNLLSVVRSVIFTLARQEVQELPPEVRLEQVAHQLGVDTSFYQYNSALQEHQSTFVVRMQTVLYVCNVL
jgi:hypothetical protein